MAATVTLGKKVYWEGNAFNPGTFAQITHFNPNNKRTTLNECGEERTSEVYFNVGSLTSFEPDLREQDALVKYLIGVGMGEVLEGVSETLLSK